MTVFPIWSNRPYAYITLDSLVMALRVARLETRQTPASASVAAATQHAPETETEELISQAHISGTTQGYRVIQEYIWQKLQSQAKSIKMTCLLVLTI